MVVTLIKIISNIVYFRCFVVMYNNDLENLNISASAPTKVEIEITPEQWLGDSAPFIYNLSTTYPSDRYGIRVFTDFINLTLEQLQAISDTSIIGSIDNNLYGLGVKPTINLPLVLEVTEYKSKTENNE